MPVCVTGHVQKLPRMGSTMAAKDTPTHQSKIKLLSHRTLEQEYFPFSSTYHTSSIRIKYYWVRVYLYGAKELIFKLSLCDFLCKINQSTSYLIQRTDDTNEDMNETQK